VNHFGPIIAAELRKRRPKPHAVWHLDEVYLKIDGRMVYLWRAVDAEGEVLDVLIQSKRNKHAALKLMRKLLKKYAVVPERMVTDDLRSYGAATEALSLARALMKLRRPGVRIEDERGNPLSFFQLKDMIELEAKAGLRRVSNGANF
jgi:transposase-like protein